LVEVLKSPAVSALLKSVPQKDCLGAPMGLTTTGQLPFAGVSGNGRLGGNPRFNASGVCPRFKGYFGDNLDFCTLKETLESINIEEF
jgi:hypothetical protein